MSSKAVTDYTDYPDNASDFRFSPRAHRAHTIHWRTWGPQVCQEAIQQDKPLFLVISSSWCEWCHVMDETTLSEPTIITILNRDFIPIRVDSDMRPDINARYNQKGWPSVALLSAEGELLWGGVYVPPKQMLYYLGHIRRYYSEHRQEIIEQAALLRTTRTTRTLTQTLPTVELAIENNEQPVLALVPDEAGMVLQDLYDGEHGGFAIHPHLKFPHPEALELLLHLSTRENTHKNHENRLLSMVSDSVEQMCEGGLWDKEAGGFFRYSAASDWSAPHTEKMLEENAALLRLIVQLADVTRETRWYELAQRLTLYINTHLWLPAPGVFAGSQSADEAYYEPGLYSHASSEAPPVDTTVYTAWNAQMISSYLLAANILHHPSLDAMALTALHWLCQHMISSSGSVYHYAAIGDGELAAQLADQVWMVYALLDAYERFKDEQYLELAKKVMAACHEELFDEESGLFYDIPYDIHAVGKLSIRMQPLTENALAAQCLLRMSVLDEQPALRETALLVLSRCLEQYRRTGIQGATYACVVLWAGSNGYL